MRITYRNAHFGSNQASTGGAVYISVRKQDTVIMSCLFDSNSGTVSGGGVHIESKKSGNDLNDGRSVHLYNNIFRYNVGYDGGMYFMIKILEIIWISSVCG